MSRKAKLTPIEQRLNQIESELKRLRLPKNQKTPKDYKSEDGFENWQKKQALKLLELNEELLVLKGLPESIDDDAIPVAVAANEIGITLNKLLNIIDEDLIEISFSGEYKAGARISRRELERALEIGGDELIRIAEQSIEEIFEDGVKFLHSGDIEAAEKAYERIEKFDFSTNLKYSISLEIGIELFKGDLDAVSQSFWFLDSHHYNDIKLVGILEKLRYVVEGLKLEDYLSSIVKEQILAVTEGKKLDPFDTRYTSWNSTEYFSQMDKNQRHAMMITSVVLSAIKKFNFLKQMEKWHGYSHKPKDEELENVIKNAIYTILEAEDTYHESPTSKLFVDKFVEFFPKRWTPAERIKLLPKNNPKVRMEDNEE